MKHNPFFLAVGRLNATLLAIFVVLKLCRLVDWSWWWVLCPLWWPLAVGAFVSPGVVIYACWKDWREERNGGRQI